jgi:hypothetical protein
MRNIPDEVCNILVDLHFLKALAYRDIDRSEDLAELKQLGTLLTSIEFSMQEGWGFPTVEAYHTHGLNSSKCKCPKMDNFEALGYRRFISSDCPLHGE